MKRMQYPEEDRTNLEANDPDALPPKQEMALSAVVSCPSLKEAALTTGLSETTLWRYMKDQVFNRRLRQARREMTKHTVARLQMASSDAVTVLHNILMNDEDKASARISAARAILDYTMRSAERDELLSRLEELEEHIRMMQEENALDSALRNEE